MAGVHGGTHGDGEGAQAPELYPAGVHDVIGDDVDDALEEVAPGVARDFKLLGDEVRECFLCVPHKGIVLWKEGKSSGKEGEGMGWQQEQQAFLKKLTDEQKMFMEDNKIRTDVGDIRQMTTEEIREYFRGRKKKKPDGKYVWTINDTQLLYTFILQSFCKIRAKELAGVKGNLRSFWYRDTGPLYKHHDIIESDEGPALYWEDLGFLSSGEFQEMFSKRGGEDFRILDRGEGVKRELYIQNQMGCCFDEFVKAGFFRFQSEFEFKDPRPDFHLVGRKMPRFLLFTEKEGLWWLCNELADELQISAMASQGEPGLLTLEYYADDLRARGVKNIEVCAFTDYDPWGFNIADQAGIKFALPVFGFKSVNVTHITSLSLFRPEVIEYAKRDLTKVSDTKMKQVNDWMAAGYGIAGPDGVREAYGMHIDLADLGLLKKTIRDWFKKVSKGEK
ncbi:MAG: hypothetical protein RDU59_11770 [Thermodesulfobacteriota bacterium]|nr:hypothetical protein [Thermodesulfobacteriota bacterium]